MTCLACSWPQNLSENECSMLPPSPLSSAVLRTPSSQYASIRLARYSANRDPRAQSRRVHSENDRIALFGGDPSKRRQSTDKLLRPFASLMQFGSQRITRKDALPLLQLIGKKRVDVVYLWTRYGSHVVRKEIREATRAHGVQFVEVENLGLLRTSAEQNSGEDGLKRMHKQDLRRSARAHLNQTVSKHKRRNPFHKAWKKGPSTE